jgi:hypothetical protein
MLLYTAHTTRINHQKINKLKDYIFIYFIGNTLWLFTNVLVADTQQTYFQI